MTTADHDAHVLSNRIRALHGTRPRQGLVDAIAAEVDNLQRRLDDAEARIARLLEDDGTTAEAPARVQAPVSRTVPSADDRRFFVHG